MASKPATQAWITRSVIAAGLVFFSALALTLLKDDVWGAFTATGGSHGNEIVSAPDFAAPRPDRTVIQKTQGGIAGFIKQGGTYRVYAQINDPGNPPSGTATVRANVSTVDTGQTAVTMTAGNYTVAGQSYNYASASLTANTPLIAGAYSYGLALADVAANSRTTSGHAVTVDNTVPTAAAIEADNKTGGVAGRAEIGDTITYTYSEQIDPHSILSGWNGSATDVVLRLNHGGLGDDTVTIFNATNAAQLPLGTVDMNETGYVSTNRTFGLTGTKSRMVQEGNEITVTLGTASGSVTDPWFASAMAWTPSAAAYDGAANATSSAVRNEAGTSDKNF
jgi:hypothetical protein